MRRKIFYTTTLILGMSSLAFPHDCSWPGVSSSCKGKDTGVVRQVGTPKKPAAAPKAEAVEPSLLRLMYV